MKLVRLSTTVAVNPEEVASVTRPDRSDATCVTMKSGEAYWIDRGYGEASYEAMDRIVKALEAGAT